MSSNQTAQQVLWMDPVHSLSAHDQAKLLEAGLVVRSVRSLLELKTAMTEQPSTPLVLLHNKTHGLLEGIFSFFPNAFKSRPLICRVDRGGCRQKRRLPCHSLRRLVPGRLESRSPLSFSN